ncbi:MAG TPA: hypothetical protein VNO30_13015 [Kofleriaceae bacterium]|nr:hypothetical protein [Kofleriaceae bacterium]
MKLARTLSLLVALAGASTVHAQAPKKAPAAAEKAPAGNELSPADVQKAEKFFDELYSAVMKNQAACPKMATAVSGLLDKHQDWLKKMVESGKDMPQASRDKLQKKQSEMAGGLGKCKDDKDVQAAMQRFMALLVPPKPPAEQTEAAPAPAPAKK